MKTRYQGPIKIDQFVAKVIVSEDKADIESEMHLRNPTRKTVQPTIELSESGIAKLSARKILVRRTATTFKKSTDIKDIEEKKLTTAIKPQTSHIIDSDYSIAFEKGKNRHVQFVPKLQLDQKLFFNKLPQYKVSFELPKEAKHIVRSSVPLTHIETVNEKLVCHFDREDAYPTPISIKWTHHDVNLLISKTAKLQTRNRIKVTIKVKNSDSRPVTALTIRDEYPQEQAEIPKGQTHLSIYTPEDRSPRVRYQEVCSIAAGQTKTLNYTIIGQGSGVSIPATVAYLGDDIVAIGESLQYIPLPPPFYPQSTAFALPSGWSFDYINGGDHHLNEHGMWCTGQGYNSRTEKLSWTNGCVYADKNFDDDYRWQTTNQVVRFSSGVSIHQSTPWLAKTGNISTHTDSLTHDDLKHFDNAVVLIRGWHFDFTSGDHHINKMALHVANVNFDRRRGKISWRTQVTYADKNFDDSYRFRYFYTILGFNGKAMYKGYSGLDKGGSMAHQGELISNDLKNYNNALIFPMGWKFDFKSNDHHINENNFKLQNIKHDKTSGKVTWNAHMQYADKNFDDDYYWDYHVLVIATNQGETRDYVCGPYTDDGGYAARNNNINLDALFVPVTWENGRQDGTETGVDCGGRSPARDMHSIRDSVDPGNGSNAGLFSLKNPSQLNVVRAFAYQALLEYAEHKGVDFNSFYSGIEEADRYVEAVAYYVDKHMDYVSDSFPFSGAQSAYRTLTQTGWRGSLDFAGDCEDFAILRAALLRSLGFYKKSIFCADHHNSFDQGQKDECYGSNGSSGGHAFNIVIYKGKYRIMDYGLMRNRYWANKSSWTQNVVDNIWNDHTGKHWDRKDVSPFGSSHPMVNYPGNPCSPSANWDWRTYYCDVTP